MRRGAARSGLRICAVVGPCLAIIAGLPAGAQGAAGDQPILLATSQQVAGQAERAKAAQVAAAFGPSVVSAQRYLTPEQLRMALGRRDRPIQSVKVHATQGVCEVSMQAEIPLGVGGLYWGIANAAESWRLLLPMLTAETCTPQDARR
jgi:hypothetical protein